MERRQNDLECRAPVLRHVLDRNSSAVVVHHHSFAIERHEELVSMIRDVFVDRVRHDLEEHVLEASFIGRTDVHRGPATDGRAPIKDLDVLR